MSKFYNVVYGSEVNLAEEFATVATESIKIDAVSEYIEESTDVEIMTEGVIEKVKAGFKWVWEKIKAFIAKCKEYIKKAWNWVKGLFGKKAEEKEEKGAELGEGVVTFTVRTIPLEKIKAAVDLMKVEGKKAVKRIEKLIAKNDIKAIRKEIEDRSDIPTKEEMAEAKEQLKSAIVDVTFDKQDLAKLQKQINALYAAIAEIEKLGEESYKQAEVLIGKVYSNEVSAIVVKEVKPLFNNFNAMCSFFTKEVNKIVKAAAAAKKASDKAKKEAPKAPVAAEAQPA